MKTKTLAIALLCALALAAASHAALPKGRVGATPAECEEAPAISAAPELAIPQLVAPPAKSEWKTEFSFHYGRADQVIYGKADGADISQPEVHGLLGLNGGKREWKAQKTFNATSWWKTADGLLSAVLDPAAKTLTVETSLRRHREENSFLAHRVDALHVWELGGRLGAIPTIFIVNKDAAELREILGQSRGNLARVICALQPAAAANLVELPDLPARTGDRSADIPAIIQWATSSIDAIARALGAGEPPGADEVKLKPCFEMSSLVPLWALMYQIGTDPVKARIAEDYARLRTQTGFPATLGEELAKSARAGASATDFDSAAGDTRKSVDAFLKAEVKKLQDHARKQRDIREVKHIWLAGLWYGRILLDLQLGDLGIARKDAEVVEKWLGETEPAQYDHFQGSDLPKFTAETGQRERDLDAAWDLYREKTYREICLVLMEDEEERIPYRLIFDIARSAQVGQVKGPRGEMAKVVKDLETYFARCESLQSSGWREPLAAAKALASKGPSAQQRFGTEMRTLIRAVSLWIDEQQTAVGPAIKAEAFAPSTVDSMPPQPEDGPQELLPPPTGRIPVNPEPSAIINPEPSAVLTPPGKAPPRKAPTRK